MTFILYVIIQNTRTSMKTKPLCNQISYQFCTHLTFDLPNNRCWVTVRQYIVTDRTYALSFELCDCL